MPKVDKIQTQIKSLVAQGNIVTIIGQPMIEENAWQASNDAEAQRMIEWLRDNRIAARATTLTIWKALADKWVKDNT